MNTAVPQEPRAWTPRFWWTLLVLVFLLHVGLIVTFSEKKIRPVRPLGDVPHLQPADASDKLIALNDPTLFALPHARDFAPLRQTASAVNPPAYHWTEPPRWLPLTPEPLGQAFGRFMQTNQFVAWSLDFKPAPKFSELDLPAPPPRPPPSTVHVRGELAQRLLLASLRLPDWPEPDLIAPSKVQVVVNAAGQVVSAVLLPPDSEFESAPHDDNADQKALALARAARFAPAAQLTVGQLIFNWRVVPLPATNAP